ncbi:hypothetical protein FJV41_19750 [Myxococcus llanfairpwllgwyngyllgogerychwyrndrobwllllantysiliogogogochensis]|uniref:Uncharacterized protein n=1 Tax=Myxococcus llanfairpwllgwyngyllgogerychwyrndrobwllllantysiliogogogochensis TaxID=2590453 RepID=A0A540WYY0_9BACT|nr:hypothetical protein [Myxococcus llanfairpwllgwyngyllgogerychwyrndrobwllllantysiliogogogochensis]TQF14206.1 hypothetical protein FJV41_19750 [Myxococcus llanfairpwllgwyngyllgogerychwyrndrobwllllantysiliogogogochensis]
MRPAIITNVDGGRVALHVFTDRFVDDVLPVTPSVPNATLGGPDQPGTWFWPPEPAKPAAPTYTPPDELLERALVAMEGVEGELREAERAYNAYLSATDGRSAVTGEKLPPFGACPLLVRAGWLAVVRSSKPPEVMGVGS